MRYSGYSGATTSVLRGKINVVADIVVLVIGTNDIYDEAASPRGVARGIIDLVDSLLFVVGVGKVIVLQTLHHLSPSVFTRYPVDIVMYNTRVDEINMHLIDSLNHARLGRSY